MAVLHRTVGLPQNPVLPGHASHGSTSSVLLPPSGGSFSSDKPCTSGRSSSVKGVAAVETETKTEAQAPPGRRDRDSNFEPKTVKRILANRQYSQKYRLKQLQYIMQLETKVKALQAQVAIDSPRIKHGAHQILLLKAENNSIRQKLSAFFWEIMFKEALYEELKKERDSLKQLFEVHRRPQQPPEMLEANRGNHQLVNRVSNQPEVNSGFIEPGVRQMVNRNLNQLRDRDFVGMNSQNQDPSQ